MIKVDRESRSGLVKLIKDANLTLKELDRKIAIFPEGTRASSQQLLPFKAGAKFVAEKLNLRATTYSCCGKQTARIK